MANVSEISCATRQQSPTTPTDDDLEKSLNNLPKAFFEDLEMRNWEGIWLVRELIKPSIKFRANFQAREGDVLLASFAKTGTTWLKSLALCIAQNSEHGNIRDSEDILAKDNPHALVPSIEYMIHVNKRLQQYDHNLYDGCSNSRRLIHTHLPYVVLPESVKNVNSGCCKIVYIARNPKDTVISTWHFLNSILKQEQDEPIDLEKLVDSFCHGPHPYGPYFDHVLDYWLESKKSPEKILFIRYEELKSDPKRQVSKIAEFVGKPFRSESEVDEVLWRCSLDRLKNLEVNNKHVADSRWYIPNSSFFRKGVVGDSKNYLTPEMEEKIDRMSREKLEPRGLIFL